MFMSQDYALRNEQKTLRSMLKLGQTTFCMKYPIVTYSKDLKKPWTGLAVYP